MVLIDIAFKTMIKIATLLFLLFVPVIIAGSAGRIVTPAVAQVTATPTPPAKATDNGREIAVGIKALTLSAEYISRECDPKWNRLTVDVSARSDAPDERPLKYHYFVDGGKIIGSGSKVKWDLGDAKKGTYHITAAVDDGCGFCGRTVTKAVTVIGVSDCECECPSISIGRNLYSVQNGDTIKFFANVKGGTAQEPTFNWIVQNGSIKAGQGTAHLVVEAKQNGTSRLKVSLEISGTEERCNCPTTATASVPFAKHSIITDADQFAFVEDLILDETELTLPPRPGERPLEGTKVSPDMLIDVATEASDPENDYLTYSYFVSGGRIIGKGKNVVWDLSGVEPGTYKITAGVDDGCGICGKTVTKVIEVFNVPIVDIECPILKISGPSSVTNSSAMKFTATITDIQTKELTYFWAVNNAEIIDGQNSDTVTVRIPANASNADSSITLKIGGLPFDWYCPSEIERTYKNGQLVTEETSRRSYQ